MSKVKKYTTISIIGTTLNDLKSIKRELSDSNNKDYYMDDVVKELIILYKNNKIV